MDVFIHPQALVESRIIGKGTRIWAFVHVVKGARIGEDCNIAHGCFIEGKCFIGHHVTVKSGVSIWDDVRLGDHVFVGPNAVFTNDRLPVSRKKDWTRLKTVVKTGAMIGANATLVCPMSVGAFAFIGAGSVVTRDVPDHAMVYGNPARIHGFMCVCRAKLKFLRNKARCKCGKAYRKLAKERVLRTPSGGTG